MQRHATCAATSRFHTTGPRLGDLVLADRWPRPTPGEAGTAICITGQLRGLPLALSNWQTTIFPVLGGADIFVVTSNTTSLKVYRPLLDSLQPVAISITNQYKFMDNVAEVRAVMTDRMNEAITFNIAHYPQVRRRGLYASLLVQQHQLQTCAELIVQHEPARKYARVVRLRSDVIFAGLGAPTLRNVTHKMIRCLEDHGCADETASGNEPVHRRSPATVDGPSSLKRQCDAEQHNCHVTLGISGLRQRARNACAASLAARDGSGAEWALLNDFVLISSRRVGLQLMQGLSVLLEAAREASRRRTILKMAGVQEAWKLVIKAAKQRFQRFSYRGPFDALWTDEPEPTLDGCVNALGRQSLVRTAGPPVQRYFLYSLGSYEIEGAASLPACITLGAQLSGCIRVHSELWSLPAPGVASGCLQLPHASDPPPAALLRAIALCRRGKGNKSKYNATAVAEELRLGLMTLTAVGRSGLAGRRWANCIEMELAMSHTAVFGSSRVVGDMVLWAQHAHLLDGKRSLNLLRLDSAWLHNRSGDQGDGFR